MRRAVICGLGLLLAMGSFAQAQDLDEVLSNYYDAIGGLDKLRAVDTLKMTGRLSMGQGIEAPLSRVNKRPDKIRQEFTFQGMTGVQAFDGEQAWMHMPFMGQTAAELMPEDLANEFREEGDMDGPLVDWADKGYQLELVGKEDVEGTEAFHIQVTRDENVQHYFLDAEYFIPIKVKRSANIQGQETEIEVTFGDYKEVDGLLFAHSVEVSGGQGSQSVILDAVEVNPEIDDSIFAMPEPPPAEESAEGEGEG